MNTKKSKTMYPQQLEEVKKIYKKIKNRFTEDEINRIIGK